MHMGELNPHNLSNKLKALLLCCFPETGKFDFPPFLAGIAEISEWQIAISHSARERGLLAVFASKWHVFCDTEEEEMLGKLSGYDLLVACPLSLNTLAKFALGIRDSFPSKILGSAVDLELPILLDSEPVRKADSLMNPHLVRIYRKHWSDVRVGAVAEFSRDDLSQSLAGLIRGRKALTRCVSQERVVITRDDVIAASQALKPLILPRAAIITDLAREEALKRGVNFEQE